MTKSTNEMQRTYDVNCKFGDDNITIAFTLLKSLNVEQISDVHKMDANTNL